MAKESYIYLKHSDGKEFVYKFNPYCNDAKDGCLFIGRAQEWHHLYIHSGMKNNY
jgi:hypothetical protein